MKYPYNLFLGSSLADLSKSKNMLSFSTRAYSSFIYQHNHRLPNPPKREKFKVLLVIANPYRTLAKALELSEEARLIEYGILGSGQAGRIEIVKMFIRTESDLLDTVRTHQPDLLHFVGGSDLSGLALMQSNDVLRPLEWEQIANIFEQQIKVSIKGTAGEQGTGLGLVLCKRFVDLNHGSISAHSKEGEGTLFVVNLPKATSAHQVLNVEHTSKVIAEVKL